MDNPRELIDFEIVELRERLRKLSKWDRYSVIKEWCSKCGESRENDCWCDWEGTDLE